MPLYPDPTPDWMKSVQDPSVLDGPGRKISRAVLGLVGAGEPSGQVMGMANQMEGEFGPLTAPAQALVDLLDKFSGKRVRVNPTQVLQKEVGFTKAPLLGKFTQPSAGAEVPEQVVQSFGRSPAIDALRQEQAPSLKMLRDVRSPDPRMIGNGATVEAKQVPLAPTVSGVDDLQNVGLAGASRREAPPLTGNLNHKKGVPRSSAKR